MEDMTKIETVGVPTFKVYTDGSRVGKGDPWVIGWSAVCGLGVLVEGSRVGGSNINAEMLAIHDALTALLKRWSLLKAINEQHGGVLEVVTDSLTSLQVLRACRLDPDEVKRDLEQQLENGEEISENYVIGPRVVELERRLSERGVQVQYTHIRGHRGDVGNAFADFVATKASGECLERWLAEHAENCDEGRVQERPGLPG